VIHLNCFSDAVFLLTRVQQIYLLSSPKYNYVVFKELAGKHKSPLLQQTHCGPFISISWAFSAGQDSSGNISIVAALFSNSTRLGQTIFPPPPKWITSTPYDDVLTLANDQLDTQILNTFITILYMYMFRAISCSSSGGHLVLSLSVSDRPVHRLRKNAEHTHLEYVPIDCPPQQWLHEHAAMLRYTYFTSLIILL
jgi:hypothetical protein